MSGCTCKTPTDIRATSEGRPNKELYLRCGDCGGKIKPTVDIDLAALRNALPDPNETGEAVTITFDVHDNVISEP